MMMPMQVPYNYLPFEFQDCTKIFDRWAELIKTTEYTLGPYVEEFETAFASYVGSAHCISTNNGTDALILSLRALGVGHGDEVITVSNTFYATVGAIVACGATPVLVDCDDRYQISIDGINNAINSNTKAILPVHWAGASPNMQEIQKIAEENNLFVVEDACMGIGGVAGGRHPGTHGNIGAFSMHPLKSLNVMGDGGMVVTDDVKLANWMRKYRNHGMSNRNEIEFWGVNMRLQPLQAIVALERLKSLDETVKKRNENARYYDECFRKFSGEVTVPKRIETNTETFSLYMLLVNKRDALLAFLESRGIEAKVHYPIPLNQQVAAQRDCLLSSDLVNVDRHAKHLITLPVHQYLQKEQLEYTVSSVGEFYSGSR